MKFYKSKIFLFSFLFVLAFVLLPSVTNAASLYFNPSSSEYKIGDSFFVNVVIDSADKSINALSGSIDFSSDVLEVVSISKTGSIVNFWVQEPNYSNANGSVSFEGVVPNPGFIGNVGRVITINFKVKRAGLAKLAYSSASVLANDGLGTNILSGVKGATFSIKEALVVPQIKSDLDVIDNSPSILNSIKEAPREDKTVPIVGLEYVLNQKVSDEYKYQVYIGGFGPTDWQTDTDKIFSTSPLQPGEHTIRVVISDRKGNEYTKIFNVYVAPLERPTLNQTLSIVNSDEPIVVNGYSSYVGERVMLHIKNNDGSFIKKYEVVIKSDGTFSIIGDKLGSDVYTMYVEVVRQDGARSLPTESVTFLVRSSNILRLGNLAISYLSIIVTLLLLIAGAIVLGLFILRYVYVYNRKVKKWRENVDTEVSRGVSDLESEIDYLISQFDGKPNLSSKEKEMLDKITALLERYRHNVVKKLGKEIKSE